MDVGTVKFLVKSNLMINGVQYLLCHFATSGNDFDFVWFLSHDEKVPCLMDTQGRKLGRRTLP